MSTARIPIDLTWSGATGSPGVNVWHARIDEGPGAPGGLEQMTDILETFYTALAGIYPVGTTVRWQGEAAGVGDDTGDFYTSPGWTVEGTGTGGFLPPANAMFVNWRTNSGGRNGRGRTFISPLVMDADETNGTPGEDFRTLLQDAADELIESSDTALNGALGVYSRVENVFRDFTSANVPNMFAVLRSRRD